MIDVIGGSNHHFEYTTRALPTQARSGGLAPPTQASSGGANLLWDAGTPPPDEALWSRLAAPGPVLTGKGTRSALKVML